MAKESDEKIVPTLIDVIIPGETNTGSFGKKTPPATPSPPPNQPRQALYRPSPPRSLIEANIETLVAQILNTHMEQMRKELIHRVITDIRTYLGHDVTHPPHEFKS
ncbi:MAG: hypothetical protein GY807_11925 [Gammaproteobacteria bacterium]|nr:hypothetical protein [Gammaproteobacteria bacterium]